MEREVFPTNNTPSSTGGAGVRALTFGSLFAGIGGFDLGFERAGMECRWQVEIDPYCQKVLAKHWPDVGRWDDVRTFPPTPAEDWAVDVICGGFPCQDISNAGKRAGIEGERSGLWFEYARIIREIRPRIVVVENVAALLGCDGGGLGRVLGSLAEAGFDAEWFCLPASDIGACQIRDRVFVVANNAERGIQELLTSESNGDAPFVAARRLRSLEERAKSWNGSMDVVPRMVRATHGISRRMDDARAMQLGNAVVPQVAEYLGRRIITAVTAGQEQP